MICQKCRKDSDILHKWLCPKCAKIKPVKLSKEQDIKMESVLKSVLNDIKPSTDEQIEIGLLIHTFMQKLSKLLKGEATIILGGSMGKDTWLR